MKGFELLVLNEFSVVCVKFMVGKWCGILVMYRQYKGEKIVVQSKIYISIAM
jgi:hypothetical protein